MHKRHILSALPFAAVFLLLVGAVLFSHVRSSRPQGTVSVNTGADASGEIYTVRVFDSVSSVLAVDGGNHTRKKEIAPSAYTYDRATTRLTFSETLPFADTVIHVEGAAAQPERFCLHDFSGGADGLLVVVDGRRAIEDFEYSFDSGTSLLTFRSDLHPEADGTLYIAYEATDGTRHSFGNAGLKEMDAVSTLEWQWLHQTKDVPMLVMKRRYGVSDRRLSREAGFPVSLPKARSIRDGTFLVETMEENEKRVCVQRWFDAESLMIECRAGEFEEAERIVSEERIEIGGLMVTKSHIIGTRTESLRSKPSAVPLVEYRWQKGGAFYQLVAPEEQAASAEQLLGRPRRG